ncbi:MAG: LuxR C-terminal-related transcriptional regulator [Thermomicrobiales bacterium]
MPIPQPSQPQNPRPAWSRYRPGTSFVGREEELAGIVALVRDPDVRLITLLGPGGVGKTRLALRVLEQLDAGPDPIGSIFISLAMIDDPVRILPTIARAIHVEEQGTRPLDTLVAQHLAMTNRPPLLVLDNAEQIVEGMGFLPGLLASCPNLTVIVTSRTVLRFSAERIVPITPMLTRAPVSATARPDEPLSPAATLFVERAHAVRPDLPIADAPKNREAIEDICAQLDGLPLAIELAAARSRFFTPQALLHRITNRLHLLTDGPRDAPERHRTLRALLTWSHDLLDADARILFRRLAVFAGGASFAAVEAVCNAHGDLGPDTESLIAQLADQSLVSIDQDPDAEPRVRMLQTIRDYAGEQLTFNGEEQTLRRAHAAWFASLTRDVPFSIWKTGTPESEERTRRYFPDQANFSLALDYLLTKDPREAVQLTLGLCVFWLEIGQLREGLAHIDRALPHAPATADDWKTRCSLLRIASLLASVSEQHERGFAYLREADTLARTYGTPRLQATVQGMIATATFRAGDRIEGDRLLRAAFDHALAIDEPILAASLQATLGELLLEAGRIEEAEPLLEEGVRVLMTGGDPVGGLYAGTLARIALWRHDLDRAAGLFRDGLDYHRRPPYRQALGRAAGFVGIAGLAFERGKPETAARLLGAAERVCIQLGTPETTLHAFGYPSLRARIEDTLSETATAGLRRQGEHWSTPEALEEAIAATWLEAPPSVLPATQTAVVPRQPEGLTARERDILQHLVQGKTNEAIAGALFISPRTVTTHVTHIYAKLGVTNRAEAIAFAMTHGIIDRGAAA